VNGSPSDGVIMLLHDWGESTIGLGAVQKNMMEKDTWRLWICDRYRKGLAQAMCCARAMAPCTRRLNIFDEAMDYASLKFSRA
jgi:hypothetical protein